MGLVGLIRARLAEPEPEPAAGAWDQEREFLQCLLAHGIGAMHALLVDERFAFARRLTDADRAFLRGARKRRDLQDTGLPDSAFNEDDLMYLVRGEGPRGLRRRRVVGRVDRGVGVGVGRRVRGHVTKSVYKTSG